MIMVTCDVCGAQFTTDPREIHDDYRKNHFHFNDGFDRCENCWNDYMKRWENEDEH